MDLGLACFLEHHLLLRYNLACVADIKFPIMRTGTDEKFMSRELGKVVGDGSGGGPGIRRGNDGGGPAAGIGAYRAP